MDMIYVHGRRKNLVSVGWQDGTLQVEFQGGRRYRYLAPEVVKDKLLRSPYPDHLWSMLMKKHHFERVDDLPPSNPVPLWRGDLDDLPF